MHNPHMPRLISLEWLRISLVLLIWVLGAVFVLLLASQIDVGPVVVDLSYNHGIHALDILAGLVVSMAATIVSVLVYLFIPSHVLSRRDRHRLAA